jgi:predicted Zn-dependent protease
MTFAFGSSDGYERCHDTALHPVKPLEAPDSHHLEAAEGWAELLAFGEAASELSKIRLEFRDHPEVLEVRWVVAANTNQWPVALSIAKELVRLHPERPTGWCCQADCLIGLNRIAEAYTILVHGQKLFPDNEIIAYDLACTCCKLGRLSEAFESVSKSIKLNGYEVKRLAMIDPKLEPIWKDLRG